MAEIECFGFSISTNESIRRRYELIHDIKGLKGFLGITPTEFGQVLLFDSRANRNVALIKFRSIYQTVRKENRTAYVDEKYLSKDYKFSVDDFGDPEFSKLMKEIESHAYDKAKAEYDKKLEEYKKEIQILKEERNDVIVERNKLQMVAENKSLQLEAERNLWNKKEKNYDKKILGLEADLRRMEKQNLYRMGE